MKRILVVLLVIASLFVICSCSMNSYVCYYAYFQDSAFLLVYSSAKNTLYKINIPLEVISQWGRSQNIASIPDAMRSFANLKESGFLLGTSQTLDAIKEILGAMSSSETPSAEDQLQVVSSRASDFAGQALLSKMNTLCGTDMSALVKVLRRTNAKTAILDASTVVKSSDATFNQQYFVKYLSQVINK